CLLPRRPPLPTLFPYTTLFRSAAYLRCGRSVTGAESRLLVREVIPVRDEHYLIREADRLSLDSRSYTSAAKQAAAANDSLVFVQDRKSTRLNSSHLVISYAVFC